MSKNNISTDTPTPKTYKRRWYILGIFSLTTFLQSALWITFSGCAKETKEYYNFDEEIINLLLAFGNIFYIIFVPFVTLAFTGLDQSLHRLVLLAGLLSVLGALIRCMSFFDPLSWWSIWVVSFGQILIALAGPIVCTAPTQLSAKWFSIDERTIATAIGTTTNNLGSGVGFLIAPYLARLYGLQMFLIIEAAAIATIFLLLLVYFPDTPPSPPSVSAYQEQHQEEKFKSSFFSDIKKLTMNWSFLLLVFVGGCQCGLLSAWQGMFDFILTPTYTEIFAGWMGFAFTATSTVGGVIGGILCDKLFQRRFRLILLFTSILTFVVLILFTLQFPSILANPAPYYLPQWLITGLLVAAGFFYGVSFPIFYEMGVELTHPISPSTSSGFYTLFMNIISLVLLLVAAKIPANVVNVLTTFMVVFCIVPLVILKEEYRRSDVDGGKETETTSLV